MKPLPDILRKNGFTYRKVHREGDVAIYEQGYCENLKYYEVFQVKIRPAREFKGVIREEHEAFPSNEQFGKTAWSYRNLEDAIRRLTELKKQIQSSTKKFLS
jgi:hypothetical protein